LNNMPHRREDEHLNKLMDAINQVPTPMRHIVQ